MSKIKQVLHRRIAGQQENGICCLNVSFFTRFRRLIANFCVTFYLNVTSPYILWWWQHSVCLPIPTLHLCRTRLLSMTCSCIELILTIGGYSLWSSSSSWTCGCPVFRTGASDSTLMEENDLLDFTCSHSTLTQWARRSNGEVIEWK